MTYLNINSTVPLKKNFNASINQSKKILVDFDISSESGDDEEDEYQLLIFEKNYFYIKKLAKVPTKSSQKASQTPFFLHQPQLDKRPKDVKIYSQKSRK